MVAVPAPRYNNVARAILRPWLIERAGLGRRQQEICEQLSSKFTGETLGELEVKGKGTVAVSGIRPAGSDRPTARLRG